MAAWQSAFLESLKTWFRVVKLERRREVKEGLRVMSGCLLVLVESILDGGHSKGSIFLKHFNKIDDSGF